jgi:WW domain-binding protein 4
VLHKESGYFYNAAIRWYYDEKSGMYYGGDPPDWTSSPPISSSSLFGAEESKDGKKEMIEIGVEKKSFSKFPKGMKVTHSHPLAGIGGYQMPTTGSFGGTTGRVADSKQETKTLGKRKGAGKSEMSEKNSKMSKQEKDALERREAARKRVQERTMQAFGLK